LNDTGILMTNDEHGGPDNCRANALADEAEAGESFGRLAAGR
jgi:hypothetical protein